MLELVSLAGVLTGVGLGFCLGYARGRVTGYTRGVDAMTQHVLKKIDAGAFDCTRCGSEAPRG